FSRDWSSDVCSSDLGKTPSIRFLIDKTRTGIAGSSSIDEMKTLFELIHLRWTAPRLDSLVFNQLKKRAIEQARQVKKTSATHFRSEERRVGKDRPTQ